MLQGEERKDRKQEQNTGNGCANRRLLTQLQIQLEMNYGGGEPRGERWKKCAIKMVLAHQHYTLVAIRKRP